MSIEVIAELAQGYEGDPRLADVLLSGALAAGAQAVKLQLVLADELATPAHEKYDWYRGLQMPHEVWQGLADRAHSQHRRLYLDVFGPESLAMAREIGADGVKLHASDFHNDDLLSEALGSFERVFISIGGILVEELEALVSRHDLSASPSARVMYGFQAYPTDIADNNLRRFRALVQRFPDLRFGFMDHSPGHDKSAWYVPIMAVALGATVVEKHMTLAHNVELTDHWSALTPDELSEFVSLVDSLEPALGSEGTELSIPEQKYRREALKIVVTARAVQAGEVLSADDVQLRRAPASTPLLRIDEVVGRRAIHDIPEGHPVDKGALE